jgi:hypothetical protein
MFGQRYQKSRGLATESAKFADPKRNEAYTYRATSHFLRKLVERDLIFAVRSGSGRRGAKNAEQTQNNGI